MTEQDRSRPDIAEQPDAAERRREAPAERIEAKSRQPGAPERRPAGLSASGAPRSGNGHARPDPRPLRLAYGVTGLAALTALTTAIVAPPSQVSSSSPALAVANAPATPAIQQVTRYVTLQPGQTPPPQAVVQQLPTPSPRTVVVTTTRQSGAPKP